MAVSPDSVGREFQKQVRRSRTTLDRLLDRRAVLGMRRYFDQAQDRLEQMLQRTNRGARTEPLSPAQAQQLLQQVKQAQLVLAQRLARMLMPVLEEAQVEGIDQADVALAKLEKEHSGAVLLLPTSELSVKTKLQERRAAKLEAANAGAWEKFATAIGIALSEAAAFSLATLETPQEAIARLRAAADRNWFRGETIIQTEMAYAFNQAQTDAIAEVSGTIKGLGKRWCELVDDLTGLPLDSRVGNDSIALHGQVAEYSGLFVMPPDPSVHPSFWNQTWACSPNRPRDRSVTVPWRREWGVPGWQWLNGQRVPVNRQG